VNRGDVYLARLDPTEGTEQAGTRPVIIVSRDALNTGHRVVVVPCTSYKGKRLYATHVFIQAGDGGLRTDSVALCDQVRTLSKTRLVDHWGTVSPQSLANITTALAIVFALV